MHYVTYRGSDGRTGPGVIEGDSLRVISTPTLRDYIELAPHERVAWHAADALIPLRDVTLLAPVVPARNIFCVGRNYLEHAKEGARAAGRELKLPDVPTFFTKVPQSLVGPDADVELEAAVSHEYDFEAELAVIIGARVKNVSEANALDAVFGYTCFNDVTARDLQRAHVQWFKGKSLDFGAPLGPWIVDAAHAGDPQRLDIAFRLNGVEKQRSTTSNMIFPVARIIAELSRGMTLLPGDVIATGTPEGVGFARTPPEFLHDGDLMEVDIGGIGVLRNTVRIV